MEKVVLSVECMMNVKTEMKEQENTLKEIEEGDHMSFLMEAPDEDGPENECKQEENNEDIKPTVAVFLQSTHEDDEEEEEEETVCESEEIKPPVAVFLQTTHEDEEEEEETICEADPMCVIVEKSSFDEEDIFTSGAEGRDEAIGMNYYTNLGHGEDLSDPGGAKQPGVASYGHYRRREASVLQRHQCSECEKTFVLNSQLEKHMLVAHSKDKPYECAICKQRFSECGTRSRHVRVVHSGERQHRCEECGKSFAQAYHLVTHLRSHSGEKPFECAICKRSFTRSEHVARHMVLHSGEKPYACEVCGKKFSHSGHLSAHHRVHSGERPYACTVCNKTFTVRGNLSRHMRLH